MKKIQILGTGCPKCRKLAENTAAAVQELGLDATIEKVTDISRIVATGVMMTPGLTVDGAIKAQGKVLNKDEIKALLATGGAP